VGHHNQGVASKLKYSYTNFHSFAAIFSMAKQVIYDDYDEFVEKSQIDTLATTE